MTRRCSLCSNNGHNSRTCPLSRSRSSTTVKLFGVKLLANGSGSSIMKKSASMGNLTSSLSSAAVSPNHSSPSSHSSDGYVSDEPSTSRNNNNNNNNNNHPPSRNKGALLTSLVYVFSFTYLFYVGIVSYFLVSWFCALLVSKFITHFGECQ